MNQLGIRSPSAKVGGLVYFGRMLDKIRAHEKNELPPDYQPNLGRGFDQFCSKFLHVHYHDVASRMKEGGSDEEILGWCFDKGRLQPEYEIYVWNELTLNCFFKNTRPPPRPPLFPYTALSR